MAKRSGPPKRAKGSARAKANMTAKAGKRRPPAKMGPHITSKQDRERGRWLASLGL